MKRSEVIERVELFLRLNHSNDRHLRKAEDLLRMIESIGMLPPSHNVWHERGWIKDDGYRMPGYYTKSNTWEPEYGRSNTYNGSSR